MLVIRAGIRKRHVRIAKVVMDATPGSFFKPEKNLDFFRLKMTP